MKLDIKEGFLKIEFSPTEKILSIHGSIEIPLSHIISVSGEIPEPTWKEIRLPGTNLPGLIKAGTYLTNRGKEFWYVIKGKDILRIELKDEFYHRLILGIDDNKFWLEKLSQK